MFFSGYPIPVCAGKEELLMENQVKIIADSTCDLTPELIEKYDIQIIPLYVTMGEENYKDGVNVRTEDLFRYSDTTGQIPKTAAASVSDFLEVFRPYAESGRPAVFIGISSELSGTMQNAVNAVEELKKKFPEAKVYPVDSLNLSTGIGLLVIHAAEMAQEGASAEAIVESLNRKIPLSRASFLVNTLTYLHMGGRCSTLQMLGASMMKLKPMLQVKNGKILNTGKFRGDIGKALRQYAKFVIDQQPVDTRRVFVTHTPMPGNEAEDIVELVKSLGIFDEVIETCAGSVIGCHCGPGTLGVLFFAKEE